MKHLGTTIALELLLLAAFFHPAPQVEAAPAVQAWARRFNSPNDSGAWALALGNNGNVYVTGSGGTNGHEAWATLGYSPAGVPVWTNFYYNATSWAIAADPNNGNVYVTGQDFNPQGDFATIAYSSGGAALWTNRHDDPAIPGGSMQVVAAGPTGNIYAGGFLGGMLIRYAAIAYSNSGAALWTNVSFRGEIEAMGIGGQGRVIFTGGAVASNGAVGFGTVAYSPSGSPLWTNFYFAPILVPNQGGGASALAVDNQRDSVYVSGLDPGTRAQFLTIAYSGAGTPLWTNFYAGPGDVSVQVTAVVVDTNSGNLYVSGEAFHGHGTDCATIVYSSGGAPLWTNRFNPSGTDGLYSAAVALGPLASVIITGAINSGAINRDLITFAYSSAGVLLWTNRYSGPVNGDNEAAGPQGLAVGADGSIYVTGSSDGAYNGVTNSEFVTIKYVPAPDIRFASINRLADSSSLLWIEAPSNTPYRLEASTNLAGWTPLTNFPALPVTSIQFTDTLAPNFPSRFYRTVWSP